MHYTSRSLKGPNRLDLDDEWIKKAIASMVTFEESLYLDDSHLDEDILLVWGKYINKCAHICKEFNPDFFSPFGR